MPAKHLLMNPLDRIVANGMRAVLEEDLGRTVYRRIEKEVHDMYGISVPEAVGDFAKLDLVMRKFFGRHASNIESKIFKRVLSVEKITKAESSITIKDPAVANAIFESYGDPAKKAILDLLRSESRSIPETIAASGLPKASAYKMVKELIRDGLLAINGFTSASDGRKVSKYASTIDKAVFEVRDQHVSIIASIQSKFLRDSYAFNSIHVGAK